MYHKINSFNTNDKKTDTENGLFQKDNLFSEHLFKSKNRLDLVEMCLSGNDMIDNKLHVVIVISNPCNFRRRRELAQQFISRLENTSNIELYICELIYGNEEPLNLTQKRDNHLVLYTKYPLWHKENLVNIAVKKLLPKDWKALSWIDADVEFLNSNWASQTLKVLSYFDIIQPFVHCQDLDKDETIMNTWTSFCYQYCRGLQYNFNNKNSNYWHPGYAWACTRDFWEKMGGIYEKSIIGSGDYILAMTLLHKIVGFNGLPDALLDIKRHYLDILWKDIKVGYVPCTLVHYYHGSKSKRQYVERNDILKLNNFDPQKHLSYDTNGVLIPTIEMPKKILEQINQYFLSRDDDEIYKS